MSKPAYERVERPANVYQVAPRRNLVRMNSNGWCAIVSTVMLLLLVTLFIVTGKATPLMVVAIAVNAFSAVFNALVAVRKK